MATAFVTYRRGGFQEVRDYDYVADVSKEWKNGYYRDNEVIVTQLRKDAGFRGGTSYGGDGGTVLAGPPAEINIPGPGINGVFPIDAEDAPKSGEPLSTAINSGSFATVSGSTFNGVLGGQTTGTPVASQCIPLTRIEQAIEGDSDVINHIPPRQLQWEETVLTFFQNSDVTYTATADNTTDTFTYGGGLAGKTITFTSTGTLPTGIQSGQLYYVVSPTSTTFQISESYGGTPVNFTTNGTGVLTAQVVQVLAEFPWKDIQGWSNQPFRFR